MTMVQEQEKEKDEGRRERKDSTRRSRRDSTRSERDADEHKERHHHRERDKRKSRGSDDDRERDRDKRSRDKDCDGTERAALYVVLWLPSPVGGTPALDAAVVVVTPAGAPATWSRELRGVGRLSPKSHDSRGPLTLFEHGWAVNVVCKDSRREHSRDSRRSARDRERERDHHSDKEEHEPVAAYTPEFLHALAHSGSPAKPEFDVISGPDAVAFARKFVRDQAASGTDVPAALSAAASSSILFCLLLVLQFPRSRLSQKALLGYKGLERVTGL
ncbi:hypothetical protein B0H14DRAFT_3562298 [Mycena olivaceomarginata]|nr:hypothetical protein B0H14DRAFT_3562298 [Mycena olivaceomarginata]